MLSVVAEINFSGVGPTPLVLDENGTLIPKAAEWLVHLKKEGRSPSLLHTRALALSRFYDFFNRYSSELEGFDILRHFWKALRDGDPNLRWKALGHRRAKQLWASLNLFTDWVSDHEDKPNPNPLQPEKMKWHEFMVEQARRCAGDMLAHLFPATQAGRGEKMKRKVDPTTASQKRHPQQQNQRHRAFSLDRYLTLLSEERNIRNVILWLLLGAGAARTSEALHLFTCDVLFNPTEEIAEVRFVDPQSGPIETQVLGKSVKMTRRDFLEKKYQLPARDNLSWRDTRWAGWKGMRMHDPETQSSKVLWMHPIFGKMMWAAHTKYLEIRNAIAPGHPWYFVNLDHNVGAPLTRRNANGLLGDACRRHAFPWPDFPHALRHMYGDVVSNLMGVDLHMVSVAMRHNSFLSTVTYTEPSVQTAHDALARVQKKI